jgi:hypothetical protein
MPPQQPDRPLDIFNEALRFRAHDDSLETPDVAAARRRRNRSGLRLCEAGAAASLAFHFLVAFLDEALALAVLALEFRLAGVFLHDASDSN